MEVVIYKNIEELSRELAEWMVSYIHETLRTQTRFTLALSGGGTPKKLNLLLASDAFNNKIDWQKLHIFWGDERYVPFNDERNNAKMAFDTLLNQVAVPPSQIHIMKTDLPPEEAAIEYENTLREYFPPGTNQQTTFDLVLLGLGDNAHTLSLFPGEEVITEKDRWVKAVFVKEVNMQRITLTAPVVNQAKKIVFMVSGADKARAVREIIKDNYDPVRYPAQVIQPQHGELYWFLDEPAAAEIK